MVGSIVLASQLAGNPLKGFIVRDQPKAHSTRRRVEGPLEPGTPTAGIDDTCTTGRSLLSAIQAVRDLDCTVVHAAVVLDRRQDAGDLLAQQGCPLTSLLVATPDGEVLPSP